MDNNTLILESFLTFKFFKLDKFLIYSIEDFLVNQNYPFKENYIKIVEDFKNGRRI